MLAELVRTDRHNPSPRRRRQRPRRGVSRSSPGHTRTWSGTGAGPRTGPTLRGT